MLVLHIVYRMYLCRECRFELCHTPLTLMSTSSTPHGLTVLISEERNEKRQRGHDSLTPPPPPPSLLTYCCRLRVSSSSQSMHRG